MSRVCGARGECVRAAAHRRRVVVNIVVVVVVVPGSLNEQGVHDEDDSNDRARQESAPTHLRRPWDATRVTCVRVQRTAIMRPGGCDPFHMPDSLSLSLLSLSFSLSSCLFGRRVARDTYASTVPIVPPLHRDCPLTSTTSDPGTQLPVQSDASSN